MQNKNLKFILFLSGFLFFISSCSVEKFPPQGKSEEQALTEVLKDFTETRFRYALYNSDTPSNKEIFEEVLHKQHYNFLQVLMILKEKDSQLLEKLFGAVIPSNVTEK